MAPRAPERAAVVSYTDYIYDELKGSEYGVEVLWTRGYLGEHCHEAE